MINPEIHQNELENIASILISFSILFVFGLCPALFLCLYPTRLYPTCLYPTRLFRRISMKCCSARNRIAMGVFADVFQGCYKDGINGTRDYRMTAAIIMLVILTVSVSSFFWDVSSRHTSWLDGVITILISVTVSFIQPCKNLVMNLSLSFHATMWSILTLMFNIWNTDFFALSDVVAYVFLILLAVPHMLMLLLGGYKLLRFVKAHSHNFDFSSVHFW